ncbi:hypothetical protein [Clostridium grantii]|uniref:Uncharacterized protein n=1 Tax=Clostridium grantii DSM 8605 TaxID=1121316 RepID=A0A1M5Y5D2_9CLOT|nr:hypothetical protein [Clostridium grantii]SHI07196.1 hypothetical protein SAMN02745207_04206 [Clostridium grantii DSM 8605]
MKLKSINNKLISVDIEALEKLVNTIAEARKSLSNRQKLLDDLSDSRSKLDGVRKKYDKDATNCPYCNHPYDNLDDLEEAYNTLTNTLHGEKNQDSLKMGELLTILKELMNDDMKRVSRVVENIDESRIEELLRLSTSFKQFISDERRVKQTEYICRLLVDCELWKDGKIEKNEVQEVLLQSLKKYTNLDFISDMNKYNFANTDKVYRDFFVLEQPKLLDEKMIEQKIKYLKYLQSL